MFIMVDYVREMTVKKSFKHGEYGSFEQLLFLCCCSYSNPSPPPPPKPLAFKQFYTEKCVLLSHPQGGNFIRPKIVEKS